MYRIDEIDKKILSQLLLDSKQSIKEIASKVNLSVSPVHERIKKMEKQGIIKDYTIVINPEKLNFHLVVYLQVKFIRHQDQIFNEFEKNIRNIEEVTEAFLISGDFDALLKVILRDMNHYNEFVLNKLSKMQIIDNVKSNFVIRFLTEGKHNITPKNLNSL